MNNQLISLNTEHVEFTSFEDLGSLETHSSHASFIQANTIEMDFAIMQRHHIIPVFTKDNEPLISHVDFIQSTADVIHHYFRGENILEPAIRVSHPIKGRIPDARHKPAQQLEEHEKTLYYERAMFVFDIPSICKDVDGQDISLSVGGVKSYGMDKLNNKKGADEHFKVFIGFSVKVCSNLSVWSDGAMLNLRVRSQGELMDALMKLVSGYNPRQHVQAMQKLSEYQLTESQFAQIMGRARLYQHLPNDQKKHIPPLLFTDTQMGAIAKDYYQDQSFCRNEQGDINLWRMYNLLTGANKSSYIDSFLDRSVNAFEFTQQIQRGLEGNVANWYLN
ncbi:MAG: hypothetical protein RL246_1629 [Bacteroidota bacterium]